MTPTNLQRTLPPPTRRLRAGAPASAEALDASAAEQASGEGDESGETSDDTESEFAAIFSELGLDEDAPSDSAPADPTSTLDPNPTDTSTGDVDFASAFGGSEVDDTPVRSEPVTDVPDGSGAPEVDVEDDDLERAMRSLFPELPGQTADARDSDVERADGAEPADASAASTGSSSTGSSSTGSSSAASPASEPSGTPVDATPTSETPTSETPESGTSFDAIKEDVQGQALAKTSDSEPEDSDTQSSKKRQSGEASTEEIEKIWSILEDMD